VKAQNILIDRLSKYQFVISSPSQFLLTPVTSGPDLFPFPHGADLYGFQLPCQGQLLSKSGLRNRTHDIIR
jgi:hypothetical protein